MNKTVTQQVSETVITPDTRRTMKAVLSEFWPSRSLVPVFAQRDIRVRYKQSFLGIAWGIVQPLTLMAILSFALGRSGRISSEAGSYPAFLLSTLVPWLFISNGVSSGALALLSDSGIVKRIYFPREIPVLGAVLASLVDFGIGILLFLILGPALGAEPTLWWLFLPMICIPPLMVCAGASMALAGLTAYYRDFRHVLPLVMQIWLFASPVIYPMNVVPQEWRSLYLVNPMSSILENFRRVLASGAPPDTGLLVLSFAVGMASLAIGYRLFKLLERDLADVL